MNRPRTIAIDFACNDPDNGLFAHRAEMASWGECEFEAARNGFRFTEIGNAIRIHRRVFPYIGGKERFGNWCWNRYVFDRETGVRLLFAMRGNWRCTCGPSRLFHWFNGQEVG